MTSSEALIAPLLGQAPETPNMTLLQVPSDTIVAIRDTKQTNYGLAKQGHKKRAGDR